MSGPPPVPIARKYLLNRDLGGTGCSRRAPGRCVKRRGVHAARRGAVALGALLCPARDGARRLLKPAPRATSASSMAPSAPLGAPYSALRSGRFAGQTSRSAPFSLGTDLRSFGCNFARQVLPQGGLGRADQTRASKLSSSRSLNPSTVGALGQVPGMMSKGEPRSTFGV